MASVFAFPVAAHPDSERLIAGTQWFTAAELAELNLPGLPKGKRAIAERAAGECWALKVDVAGLALARPRRGRGGHATEFNIAVLPAAARLALAKSDAKAGDLGGDVVQIRNPAAPWAWFDALPQADKDEAKRRLRVIDAVERLIRTGCSATLAVASVAAEHRISRATIWNWRALVEGIAPVDALPALAPRRAGGGKKIEISGEIFTFIQSDYLRQSQPSWESCYYRLQRAFDGVALLSSRTLWRKFKRETPVQIIALKRGGDEALRKMLPFQRRSVAEMHAMELVNIDGHDCDVFVRFPGSNGQPDHVGRPTFLAIQDIYSRKILAWAIAETEDSITARLVFSRLFKDWGIPKGLLADNGHAFASKWITGGIPNRYRFKVKDDEPTGLLTALGVEVVWALPYRGSSKPIERGFRDFCDAAAKHPAFEGAYTGNSPMAKPENYGDRAIPLAEFEAVWAECVKAHNAKPNRRTEMAKGTMASFDQVFADSYATAPIGKATPEQLRMAMLMPDEKRCNSKSGEIELYGNRYWTPALLEFAGKRVIVRFDPDDLHSEIHVYTRDGRYLLAAPIVEDVGFRDAAAGKARGRQIAEFKKATKALAAAENLLTAAQLADRMPRLPDETSLEPAVIRPVRHRGQTAAALKPVRDVSKPAPRPSVIDRLTPHLRVVE